MSLLLLIVDGSVKGSASLTARASLYQIPQLQIAWVELDLPAVASGATTGSATLTASAAIITAQAVGVLDPALLALAALSETVAVSAASVLSATASLSTAQGVGAAEANSASGSLATGQGVGVADTLGATASDTTAQGVAANATLNAVATNAIGVAVGASASLSATATLVAADGVGASCALSALATLATAQGVGVNELELASASGLEAVAIGGPAALGAVATIATTQGVGAAEANAASGSLATGQGVGAADALGATASNATAQGVAANETLLAAEGELQAAGVAGSDVLAALATINTAQGVATTAVLSAVAATTTTQGVATSVTLQSSASTATSQGVSASASLSATGNESPGSGSAAGLSAAATLATAQGVATGTVLTGSAAFTTTQGVAASETMLASAGEQQNGGVAGADVLAATATLQTAQGVATSSALIATATSTTAQGVAVPDVLTATAVIQEQAGAGAGSTLSGNATSSSSGTSGIFGDGAPSAVATLTTTQAVATTMSGAASATMDAEPPAPPPAPPSQVVTIGGYPTSVGGWTKQAGRYLDNVPLPVRATADADCDELVGQSTATIGHPTYIEGRVDSRISKPIGIAQAQYVPAPIRADANAEVVFESDVVATIIPIPIVGSANSNVFDPIIQGTGQAWSPASIYGALDDELPETIAQSSGLVGGVRPSVADADGTYTSAIEAQAFGISKVPKLARLVAHASGLLDGVEQRDEATVTAIGINSIGQAELGATSSAATGTVWHMPALPDVGDVGEPNGVATVELSGDTTLYGMVSDAIGTTWPAISHVGFADTGIDGYIGQGVGVIGAPGIIGTGQADIPSLVVFALGETSVEDTKHDDDVALWLLGLIPLNEVTAFSSDERAGLQLLALGPH